MRQQRLPITKLSSSAKALLKQTLCAVTGDEENLREQLTKAMAFQGLVLLGLQIKGNAFLRGFGADSTDLYGWLTLSL